MTSDKVSYDPEADVWLLPTPGGAVRFDFLALPYASAALRTAAKRAMRASLATRPARSVHGDFKSLQSLFRRVAASYPGRVFDEITPELVRAHDASLAVESRYQAGLLSVTLRRWAGSGAGGLAEGLDTWLAHEPTPSHDAGHAVRTCSRTRGALRPQERDTLLAALHAAYDAGRISVADYAMALLVGVLGLRPLQLVCLKIGDLRPPSDASMFAADLMVARLKQKNGRRPRDVFTPYGLITALADVLHHHCAQAARRAARFGVTVPDAPMFPAAKRGEVSLPGFVGHLTVAAVSRRVSATFDRLGALRDRPAGGHVFPLRLRRTLATLLHEESGALAEISVLLNHTKPGMARAYIEASPAFAARLDDVMGAAFSELAARFGHVDVAAKPEPGGAPRA